VRVELRPARASDVAALSDIVQRAYEPYVERIGRRPAPMDDDYASRVQQGQVEVAAQTGEIVGLIVLIACDGHLLIENVAVDPDQHGRGVGRALLAHAEAVAANLDLPEVQLYTNAAMTENLKLYPRLGYREAGRQTEDGFERVFFSKPVPTAF
jgi:ribosomal protein S18 acetylase RimI-like enzyme